MRHRDTDVTVGDLVYLFVDRNKHHPRDKYSVVSVDASWCNIKKMSGAQLRSSSYRVKRCECYKVKEATILVERYPSSSNESLSDLSAPVVPADTRIDIPAPAFHQRFLPLFHQPQILVRVTQPRSRKVWVMSQLLQKLSCQPTSIKKPHKDIPLEHANLPRGSKTLWLTSLMCI